MITLAPFIPAFQEYEITISLFILYSFKTLYCMIFKETWSRIVKHRPPFATSGTMIPIRNQGWKETILGLYSVLLYKISANPPILIVIWSSPKQTKEFMIVFKYR